MPEVTTTSKSIEEATKQLYIKRSDTVAVIQQLEEKSKETAKPEVPLALKSPKSLPILSRAHRIHPNLNDLLNRRRKRTTYRIKRDANPRELLALLALLSDKNALESITANNDQDDQVVDEGGDIVNPFARATYRFLNQRPQVEGSDDEVDGPSSFSRSRFGGIRTQQQRPKAVEQSRQVRLGFQPLSQAREPSPYLAKPDGWGEFTNLYRPEASDDENTARLYSLSNLLAENGRSYDERRKRYSHRRLAL